MTKRPHMFSRIFDFSYTRTPLQAVGFYLAQLLIYLLLSSLFFALLQGIGVIDPVKALSPGVMDPQALAKLQSVIAKVNPVIGILHAFAVTMFMLNAKNMQRIRKYILMGALATVLGILGSALFSLMVVAYLSTRPVEPAPVKQ